MIEKGTPSGIVVTPLKDLTEIEKKINECRRKCVNAGITFEGQTKGSLKMFPINVQGIVPEHDLIVPSSELAMHVGAAGKKLLAWSVVDNYAHIVYASEGCCDYAHGLPDEVLSKGVREVMKGI